jgi:peptidoglycan/xylan/chitin deacetylase (PgdA/CDA1 family)
MTRVAAKRGLKRLAGWASVLASPGGSSPATTTILMYHRIARCESGDQRLDAWNVRPSTLERHLATLALEAEAVPLDELVDRLPGSANQRRPLVAVTFDDGFANACSAALPLLERYAIPATFFVATAYIGSAGPMPFDGWGRASCRRTPPDCWRAATWSELERAVRTGLVTIGSHSHSHVVARNQTTGRLREEAERSREAIRAALGPGHGRSFAYPYGSTRLGDVPPSYERAVRAAGYVVAVTTDLDVVTAATNRMRLPRIEVGDVDSPAVLRSKIRGSLLGFRITDLLRRPVAPDESPTASAASR